MHRAAKLLIAALCITGTIAGNDQFNPLRHLGGNSPWFSGMYGFQNASY